MSTKERKELQAEYRRVRCTIDKVIRELSYTKLGIRDLLLYSNALDSKQFIHNYESTIHSIHNCIDDLKNALDLIENKKATKVEDSYKTDKIYNIDNKLKELIGSKFDYNKIRECFPSEAFDSFTLNEAEHGLGDEEFEDDDEIETYLADSDYTEYYHVVVKDGMIIETR